MIIDSGPEKLQKIIKFVSKNAYATKSGPYKAILTVSPFCRRRLNFATTTARPTDLVTTTIICEIFSHSHSF